MSEAQARASAEEFEEWRVFSAIDPPLEERLDLLLTRLARAIWGDDYKVPEWWGRGRQTEEEMKAKLAGVAKRG